MRIQLALDARTGFPCVSLDKGDSFISVLPAAKIQVEQWITHCMPFAAETVTDVIRRLEQCYVPAKAGEALPIYPDQMKLLDRTPVPDLDGATVSSIAATNLRLWEPDEFPLGRGAVFPTPRSEWGLFLFWTRGRVPDSEEWKNALTTFERLGTQELLYGILDQDIEWAPVVKGLLKKLLEVIPGAQRGLPLMNAGVYELVSDTRTYSYIDRTIGIVEFERPIVAGESLLWPAVEENRNRGWRAVFRTDLPVVTVRPWYRPEHVINTMRNGQVRAIELSEKPIREEDPAPVSKNALRRARVARAVSGDGSVIHICPECCRVITRREVKKNPTLYCVTRRAASGATDDEEGKVVDHVPELADNEMASIIRYVQIHSEYLDILRMHPEWVLPVTLSGFTKAGKSTWLLSLIGMTEYPPSNPRLTNIFPDDWVLDKRFLSMVNPTADKLTQALGNMWVFGDVPKRDQPFVEAMHSPILFTVRKPGPLHEQTGSVVPIFVDIAGEVIIDPQALANHKHYPHVRATREVIFIHPAHSLSGANTLFEQFVKALEGVPRNGKNIKAKNLNLIFGLSMIDRLKYPVGHDREATAKNRELFRIFMDDRPPLTYNRDPQELHAYLENMKKIHFQLRDLIRRDYRQLFTSISRFGSVRFCGFSAFGFEPVNEGKTEGVEASLPFEPQPVGVLDPLLWLLRDSGVI